MDMKGVTKLSVTEGSSSYQWNFRGKPDQNILPFNELNNSLASTSGEIEFRCGTNILAFVDHHISVYTVKDCDVYINIYIRRTKLNNENIADFTDCVIHRANVVMKASEADGSFTTYQFEQLSDAEKLAFKSILRDEDIEPVDVNAAEFWFRQPTYVNTCKGYCYSKEYIRMRRNYINELNFQIQIFHRNYLKNSLKTKNSKLVHLNSNFKPGFLNTASLFFTQEFSDFVIKCGSKTFPVHKLIIANMSPVLAAMLQQPLQEVQEGFMTITDSDPSTVEQFIKFMYTGTANIEEFATELFLISNKYDVEDLKALSENVLVKKVNGDNFLELCKVGKLVNSAAIMNKCFNIFKMKKNDLIETTEDIKRFTEEYPDLMLKLFQSV